MSVVEYNTENDCGFEDGPRALPANIQATFDVASNVFTLRATSIDHVIVGQFLVDSRTCPICNGAKVRNSAGELVGHGWIEYRRADGLPVKELIRVIGTRNRSQ